MFEQGLEVNVKIFLERDEEFFKVSIPMLKKSWKAIFNLLIQLA
jgi:hypothetical protein